MSAVMKEEDYPQAEKEIQSLKEADKAIEGEPNKKHLN